VGINKTIDIFFSSRISELGNRKTGISERTEWRGPPSDSLELDPNEGPKTRNGFRALRQGFFVMQFFLSHFGSCPVSFFLSLSVFPFCQFSFLPPLRLTGGVLSSSFWENRKKINIYFFLVLCRQWLYDAGFLPLGGRSAMRFSRFSPPPPRPSFASPKNNIVAKFGITFNTSPSCQAAAGGS
jgi:hypothetical protein